MTTPNELDEVAAAVRQYMNTQDIPPLQPLEDPTPMTVNNRPPKETHLSTTQQVVTTLQHWTATEAATLLVRHAGRIPTLHMSPDARMRALADIIGHIVRTVDTTDTDIAEVRDAIINDTPDDTPEPAPSILDAGHTEMETVTGS